MSSPIVLPASKLGRWFPDIVPVRGRTIRDEDSKADLLADIKVDDIPSLASLREAIRKLLSAIHQLEGRNGPITILEDVTYLGDVIFEGDVIMDLEDVTMNGYLFLEHGTHQARLMIETSDFAESEPPEVSDPSMNAMVIFGDSASQRLKLREFPQLTAHWLVDQTIHTLAYQGGVWLNMPAAVTEMFGDTRLRVAMDLTNYTQFRVTANLTVPGTAGAVIYPQYDAGAGFAELNSSSNGRLPIDSTGVLVGDWVDIATLAKADVELKMMGQDGNGADDPNFGIIQLHLR